MLSPRFKLLILPVAAFAVASCSKTTTHSGGVPKLDARKAGKVGDGTLERLGDQAMKQNQHGMAASFYARALHRKPREVALHKKLGFALFKARNYAAAEKAFKQAIALSPSDTEIMRGHANSLVATGRASQAIPIYKAAIAKSGRSADHRLHNGLGVAYDSMGRHTEAQKAYRQGLAANAGNLTLRNNLALSLSASGAHARAVELLTAVAASARATDRHRANLARVRAKASVAGVKMPAKKADVRKASLVTKAKTAGRSKVTKDKMAPKAVKRRRLVKAAEKPVRITGADAKSTVKEAAKKPASAAVKGAAVKGSEAKARSKKSYLLNLMKSKRKIVPSAKDLSRGFEPASGTSRDFKPDDDSAADDAFLRSLKAPGFRKSRRKARRSAARKVATRKMAARKTAKGVKSKAAAAKTKSARKPVAKKVAKSTKRRVQKTAVRDKRPAHRRTARRLNRISTAAGAAERTEDIFR